ncbi:calpain-A-like isoform X3 [Rhodnius prolixus]|uniref:calpain-A-like isoform X3 n=1 Tax=Rhodnius prolixus TaxID=13249 RepID=UPI003D18D2A2
MKFIDPLKINIVSKSYNSFTNDRKVKIVIFIPSECFNFPSLQNFVENYLIINCFSQEICNNPKFFVSRASRFDVQQGISADCWLAVTIANLPSNPHLFELIVPDGQSFEVNYAGIFHFRFWRFGRWVDVVIDDRLPTDQDELVYLHSSDKNEFWSALVEKAFAKIHGSYELLNTGDEMESLEDFTGGICEIFDLRLEVPNNLYRIMLKAYERSSLMACANLDFDAVVESRTPQGLITGHAYSVTKVQYVEVDTPTLSGWFPLVRIRNPWGTGEWNGAWSDNWPEWNHISEKTKKELEMQPQIDGEFWISYTDFLQYFHRLCICNLHPDLLNQDIYKDDDSKLWKLYCFEGEWVRGNTAGGCRRFWETHWRNPQYRIKLVANLKNDSGNKCTVIIALMQKYTRAQKKIGAVKFWIGFDVYYLEDLENLSKPLNQTFFFKNNSAVVPSNYIYSREVSHRCQLSPGEYCIVPSTYYPNEEGEFLLRVFTKEEINMEEYDEELEISTPAHSRVQGPKKVEKRELKFTTKTYAKFADRKEIDWVELKEILDEELGHNHVQGGTGIIWKALSLFSTKYDFEPPGGFSKEICRSFIAMMDIDRSCKLGLEEFTRLFIVIREWKAVFESYDKAKTGYLEPFSLNEALKSAGFKLNNRVRNALCHIYASSDGRIRFDDFFMCAVRLDTVMNNFKNNDPNNSNEAKFSLEELVANIVYF